MTNETSDSELNDDPSDPVDLVALAYQDAREGRYVESVERLRRYDQLASTAHVAYSRRTFDDQGKYYRDGGWDMSPAFYVVASDVDRACAAMARAALRLGRVTDDGREAEDWDDDSYTPNWISDVHVTPHGALLVTDTKGEVTEPMALKMMKVIVAELNGANVTAVVVSPPRGEDLTEYPTWTDPSSGTNG